MSREEAFARWLAAHYPEVFGAALTAATKPTKMNLSGWGDALSSIGSAITSTIGTVAKWGSSAISSVANYVLSTQGQQAIGKLADLYVTTRANKDAIGVQLTNLANNNAPAPIATTTNSVTGTTVPLYAPAGQVAQPLTPALSQQLYAAAAQPGGGYMVPLAIGGGLLLFMFMRRKRR